jgi:hypothetical protein
MADPLTPEQEAAEQLAAETAQLETQVKLRRELNELTLAQIKYLQDLDQLTPAQKTALQSIAAQREKNLNLLEKEIKYYDKLATQAKSEQDRSKNELKTLQAKIDKQKQLVKEGKAEKDSVTVLEEEYEKLDKTIKNAKETASELVGAFGDLLKGNLTDGLKKLGGALAKNLKNKLMDRFTDSIFSMVRAGPKGIAALAGIAAAFVAIGVAVAITMKIVKMAIAVVDASNAFQKATGTSNEFASSLVTVGNEARKFGGTVEEVSASFQSLFTNVSDFTMMSKASREELIKTNTVLSKLGIANDDLAKSQQFMIKTMGQSAEQAAATSRELAAFASDIGVAPSKMMSDLASAGPQLAKFGRDATSTFKDLAQTAKITGIEINRLLAITDKFDTFEGAAEQAGKLNAALGGNFVNAMELLTETDPTKRFEMMTGAIKDAGKSFDEMTYFEAKFFAQAMGLSDVSELALALSGNMDQVGKFTKKSSDEYERLAQRAAKVQSFQEKMNTLMAQLIPIVEPLVNGLMRMSDWMAEHMEAVKVGFVTMIVLTSALAAAMSAMAIATMVTVAPIAAVAAGIAAVIAGVIALGTMLFVYPWGSNFGDASAALGEKTSFLGSSFLSMAEDVTSAEAAVNKFGNTTFKGNRNLKVGTEMTTKSIQDMNVAMKDASVSPASARTEANAYNMSQIGDTITTNNNSLPSDQTIVVNIGEETIEKTIRKGISRVTRSAAMVS